MIGNLWLRLRRRRALDRDLDEELRFHRQMRAGDEDAPPFGHATLIKEDMRNMWSLGWIDILAQDARYALRGMRRYPAFTITAITLLALAIGVNTAIFSVVKRVLIDPLPYPDSNRLVQLWQLQKQQGSPFSVTSLDYLDWAAQSKIFDGLAAYTGRGLTLTGLSEPEMIMASAVSANFFRVLGVEPALGRGFRAEENERGRGRVLVISHGFWQRKFGGSPSALGRVLRVNGEPHEIIGVMPPGFAFPEDRFAAWIPLTFKGGDPDWINRRSHYLRVFGRLKSGETLSSGAAEMKGIAAQLERQYPETNRDLGVRLRSLKERIVGDASQAIYLLYGAATVLLLIACMNLAGLLAARSAARRDEFVMRAALGAGRARMISQVAVETALLSLAGGIAGVGLAFVLLGAVRSAAPESLPRLAEIELDRAILAFSLGLSAFTGLIFALAPAASLSRLVRSSRVLGQRARSVLVVAQVGLAVVLLSGAGLVLRSFHNLNHVELGFRTDDVATLNFLLDDHAYPSAQRLAAFVRDLDERLAASPGILAAGVATKLPLTAQGWGEPIVVEGHPATSSRPATARFASTSPGYLRALGTPLRAGRHFTGQDDARSTLVALVDEPFVKAFLPAAASPIGIRIRSGGPDSSNPWLTIVGVIAETRQLSLDGAPEPHVFLPYAQLGQLAPKLGRGLFLAARSHAGPAQAIATAKSQLASIDRDLPLREIELLRTRLDQALSPHRFRATVMTGFAGAALLLAAVGLYGVIAYAVSQRTREIGLRIALGASPGGITRMVVAGGLRLAALGIALGIAGALMLSRLVEGMLFGVGSRDAATLIAVSLTLGLIAAAASYLPSRRAAQLDPMRALRTD